MHLVECQARRQVKTSPDGWTRVGAVEPDPVVGRRTTARMSDSPWRWRTARRGHRARRVTARPCWRTEEGRLSRNRARSDVGRSGFENLWISCSRLQGWCSLLRGRRPDVRRQAPAEGGTGVPRHDAADPHGILDRLRRPASVGRQHVQSRSCGRRCQPVVVAEQRTEICADAQRGRQVNGVE